MKGDFTKFTHKAQNHFNRVYKQQGRVELDSDSNEAADLFTHLNRTEAIDVIGQVGVPKGDSFKVDVVNNNTDLMIHAGRMYVEEPEIKTPVIVPRPLFLAILICAIGTVVMGVYPEPWVQSVMEAARGLF